MLLSWFISSTLNYAKTSQILLTIYASHYCSIVAYPVPTLSSLTYTALLITTSSYLSLPHLYFKMQYWASDIAGLTETLPPLFAYIKRVTHTGATTALNTYGCKKGM